MTTRSFAPATVPAIAYAVHRATSLGEPAHEVGQGQIERQVRRASDEFARERADREGER